MWWSLGSRELSGIYIIPLYNNRKKWEGINWKSLGSEFLANILLYLLGLISKQADFSNNEHGVFGWEIVT